MTLRAHATAGIVTLATTLLSTSLLAAQDLVQVTGQDRLLDPDFEEVFQVGVIEGESWEMFGRLHKVAFDARRSSATVVTGHTRSSTNRGTSLRSSRETSAQATGWVAVHAWLPPRGEPGEGLPQNVQVEGRTVDLSSAYGNRAMPSVFEPPLLAGILPDGGIVYSDSSAYALKVTSPASREIARIITRPFRPAPVTPSVIEGFAKGPEAARLRALRAGMAAGTGFRVTGSDDVGAASDEHRHPRGGYHDARRLRPGRSGRVHRTR